MLKDFFRYALKNLRNRQLRSWLTIIGIVIGVASIMALITVSQGLENAISEQFEKIGSNRIYVMSAGVGDPSARTGLLQKDVDRLEKIPELEWVTPYFGVASPVEFGRESLNTRVWGVPDEDMERRWADMDIPLEEGRYFSRDEKYSAMIGIRVTDDMFERDVRINNNLKIEGEKFKVVGIFSEIGNSDDDNMIMIPIKTAWEITGKQDEVTMIELVIKNPNEMDRVAAKVQRTLEKIRDEESFKVITPEQLLAQMGSILDIVQIVLVGIAAISLLVGGLGIMNSMYTNVIERTNEIGIMKSIGARNSDILIMFMLESGIMGFVGGVLGVLFGLLISYGVEAGAAQAGFKILKIVISPGLVAFGIGFAVVVGMIAGALPSRQASQLKPIEALRYD